MSSLIPVVEDISGWDSCKEIIYKCPKCNTSFRTLGNREKFCHNCGQEITWSNVPTHLDESYIETDFDKRKQFINELNTMIQKCYDVSDYNITKYD